MPNYLGLGLPSCGPYSYKRTISAISIRTLNAFVFVAASVSERVKKKPKYLIAFETQVYAYEKSIKICGPTTG